MNKIIAVILLLFTSAIFASTTSVEVPNITKSVSTVTTYKFTETLSVKLPIGYKVKIDLNNGKGLVAMTCSATTCTLSSNALPKDAESASYKVGVYDAKGVLQGTEINANYALTSTASINTNPTSSSKNGYSKISNAGILLPDTATLGAGANDWACTKDNKTGLIWEVKTKLNLNDTYTNYTLDYPTSTTYTSSKFGNSTNSDGFVNAVNKRSLCGATNWRLPTLEELMSIIECSDNKYDTDGSCISYLLSGSTINNLYFPNTTTSAFWSSSPFTTNIGFAWVVHFGLGDSGSGNKNNYYSVRLVRK